MKTVSALLKFDESTLGRPTIVETRRLFHQSPIIFSSNNRGRTMRPGRLLECIIFSCFEWFFSIPAVGNSGVAVLDNC